MPADLFIWPRVFGVGMIFAIEVGCVPAVVETVTNLHGLNFV